MRRKKDKHGEPIFSKASSKSAKKSKSQHSILKKHEDRLEEYKKARAKIAELDNTIGYIKGSKNEYSQARIDVLEDQKQKILSENDEMEYLLEASPIIMRLGTLEQEENRLLNNELMEEGKIDCIMMEKTELINEYLTKFDPKHCVLMDRLLIHQVDVCSSCKSSMITANGYAVCNTCGDCVATLHCQGEMSYKELQDYDYRPAFTYDKMSHLEDWLKRFQSKENRAIPRDIVDRVILEAHKERIKDLNLLTEDKVKRYLKKLQLNEYYDNVIGIINRINSRPPFKLTTEIENKIKSMFQQIQDPYEKFKPKNRKNFLSYSYVLHKFFQILGLHEFTKYFPLLKSSDKLRQQDEIFKKIVNEMAEKDRSVRWVFFPSI
jgi:hypothetical protein